MPIPKQGFPLLT